jgi:hypothetical protein
MPKVFAIAGQLLVYGLTALLFGIFSTDPSYRAFPEDKAQILLTFSHVGQRKGECRKLTREEIQEMAANMRRAEICPRERLPVTVELELSGEVIYHGASQAHRRFMVEPGPHHLVARLRDGAESGGFNYQEATDIELQAGENFIVDFRSEMGGFLFGTGRERR